jgi:hypothetical protein
MMNGELGKPGAVGYNRTAMMTFRAHSDGKVIIPDEPVEIPRRPVLHVTVEEVRAEPKHPSRRDTLLRLAREAEAIGRDLPEDLAEQLDHYLYGTPKR